MPSWLSAPQPPAPTLLCAALPPLTLSRSLPLRCRSVAPGRNRTICHYKGNAGPPANFTEWGMLIGSLAEHMVRKFGEQTASEFFFEVARLSSRLRSAHDMNVLASPSSLSMHRIDACVCGSRCGTSRMISSGRVRRLSSKCSRSRCVFFRRSSKKAVAQLGAVRPRRACDQEGEPEAAGWGARDMLRRREHPSLCCLPCHCHHPCHCCLP